MSEENEEQSKLLLNNIWNDVIMDIAKVGFKIEELN